jgi:glutamate dehydrogenase
MMARALASLTHGVLGVRSESTIADRIATLSDCADSLSATDVDQLPTYLRGLQQRRIRQNAKDGVPTELASSVAQTTLIAGAPVLTHLVSRSQTSPSKTAEIYLNVGDALSLDRLRAAAELALNDMPYWDRLATRGLIRELEQLQSDAAQMALALESPKTWLTQHRGDIRNLVSEIKTFTGSKPSFAQFALATDAVRKFMQNASDA